MEIKFSVLLSVYFKENPLFLRGAIESIYMNQSLKPTEIILVEDGPLTEELEMEIDHLKERIGENILKSLKLPKNVGLGNALKAGVEVCQCEYIARMDTDDISYPNRFEKQFSFLEKNPEVDVLGSYMSEFSGNIGNVVSIKDTPSNTVDMKQYMKWRDPINHPSVVLKKSKVLEAGNYQEIFLNEDSYLWARMLCKGAIFKNIEEPLVYFRVNDDTYKRRGGWRYVKAEWKLQKEYLRIGLTNYFDFCKNMILKSIVRLMPNGLRKMIYSTFLRKKK